MFVVRLFRCKGETVYRICKSGSNVRGSVNSIRVDRNADSKEIDSPVAVAVFISGDKGRDKSAFS